MFQDYKESVAVYLRKSRMDPDTESIDDTLSRHEDTLMKFAKEYKINVVKVYKEVVSGDGLFTRPEMLKLLQDIEADMYSGVLCMEIDRLGRSSQKDGGIILETFQEHSVAIITPNKTYDLNDEFDEQSVEMQSFIARQELKSIKRRLRRGTEKTVEQGCHITEPPYGYRRTYIDKKPTLEIYEEEANAVRMVFDWYVNQGYGSYTIARKLNELGYKPRKGNEFSRTSVTWILRNKTYIGKIIWNKNHVIRKKNANDVHHRIPNPEDKWIVSEGLHPAIISQELFDQAQDILNSRSHPPAFTGEIKNPFAGLVFCNTCGLPIQRQHNLKRGICERMLCVTPGCTRSIKSELFETAVFNALKDLIRKDNIIAKSEQAKKITKQHSLIDNAIKNLERELKAAQSQKAKLHDFLEQGVYDVPTFMERNKIISDKIRAYEKTLHDYEHQIRNLKEKPLLQEVLPKIDNFIKHYAELTPSAKNVVYKQLIRRIDYGHTPEQSRTEFTVDIDWNFIV